MAPVVQAWPVNLIKLPEVRSEPMSKLDPAKTYSIHQYTGVDKAHAAGIKGKGAVVAIVDTGIEYTHTAVRLGLPQSISPT
jgi:subtilisin family serine protease